jgi:ACS family pantothenate transporter-like MFS transporter
LLNSTSLATGRNTFALNRAIPRSNMANSFIAYLRGDQNAPGERKLVQKLDFFILTFCCLMYFLNYLDRTNLNNAYVSGMREELDFKGNQLNQINTVFTVG